MDFIPIIIDIAFVALLVFYVIEGRRKGFVKMVLSFGATILSWLIAAEFSQPLAEWANDNFVHGWISGALENAIADSLGNGTDALIEAIPDYIANVAEIAGISIQNIAQQLGGSVDPAQAAEQLYAAVENAFVVSALRIVAFFILYAIISRILAVGIRIINRFFKLPIIKSFNKLLGGVAGALKGILVVAVITLVLTLFVVLAPETEFSLAVEQSSIYKLIFDSISAIFSN